MLTILYEDENILVPVKPAGIQSQSVHRFEPDMVSEIRKHLVNLSTTMSTNTSVPYVGVIHRLDKPVGGVMVYAKEQKAAAALSKQVQDGKLKKIYYVVICGKPVDNMGKYVDFLRKDGKNNYSQIVDKSVDESKRAELSYEILGTKIIDGQELSLAKVQLMTGRHHQIRVQFAGHGLPVLGDAKYGSKVPGRTVPLALWAAQLQFVHPVTGKEMRFSAKPESRAFKDFMELF
ncbi:MAG: RluA family pseudouridine synthase [Lachnospiraceae bacterium]